MPKFLNYKVLVEQDEDSKFMVSFPAIPGCYTKDERFLGITEISVTV